MNVLLKNNGSSSKRKREHIKPKAFYRREICTYISHIVCIYIKHIHAYPLCISFYLRALPLPAIAQFACVCSRFSPFFLCAFSAFSFFFFFGLRALLLSRSLMHVNEFNWIISCHFGGLLSLSLSLFLFLPLSLPLGSFGMSKLLSVVAKNSPWSMK